MRAWLHRAEQDFYNSLPAGWASKACIFIRVLYLYFECDYTAGWTSKTLRQQSYLFKLKNLPLVCRLFFPLASNAYFLPEDTLMCI